MNTVFFIIVFLVASIVDFTCGIMLKRDCPPEEQHRSCSFYDEYTCWDSQENYERLRAFPKKKIHCSAGCFCKKGLVRQFPGGKCMPAGQCKDKRLVYFFKHLPADFSGF